MTERGPPLKIKKKKKKIITIIVDRRASKAFLSCTLHLLKEGGDIYEGMGGGGGGTLKTIQ